MSESRSAEAAKAPLSIVVLGASGDLARKKIYPALFSLYSQDLLSSDFQIYGFSRSALSAEAFRDRVLAHLTCRYVPGEKCAEKQEAFMARCHYVEGAYDSADAFLRLYQAILEREGRRPTHLVFYMAIPPFLFLDVARAIGAAGLVQCDERDEGFSRVVIEKPFGHDRASSDELVARMAEIFSEQQTFRIDHYLGKEAIQNLIALRFANRVFEPIWNREHIAEVRIAFQEKFGVEGRAGYFDKYGIVRDVMQNHLLQILALAAMERPERFDATHVRNEKVRVLRSVAPLKAGDFALGQYAATRTGGVERPGYTDDPDIAADSRTPTFAQAILRIDNDRWRGVPFVMSAGKALEQSATQIAIRFRPVSQNIFQAGSTPLATNELTIRVQPNAAIMLRIMNKKPGLGMALAESDLDLHYESAFDAVVPEAYESLILDVIRGDKSLFIRKDELEAAWDIFTPALREIEESGIRPEPYAYGSSGPEGAARQIEALQCHVS